MQIDFDDRAIQRLQDAVRRLARVTAGRSRSGVTHHHADDDFGTAATDDAIGFDPFPLLRALDEAGVQAVVIGQVAGIMHGSRELTGDLDLLWDGRAGNAPAMASAFSRVHATLTDDDDRPLDCTAEAFGLPKVLFRTEHASGDCCTTALPWGSLEVDRFLGRCHVVSASDGFKIFYLGREDLITMRRAVGRPKDVRRADELAGMTSAGQTLPRN